LERFAIFQKNLEWINAKNAENLGFTVAINHFADMTLDEIRAKYFGGARPIPYGLISRGEMKRHAPEPEDVPASIDWRELGAVTPISDQGQCDATWAYSTLDALEAANFIKYGKLVKLASQQQLDCGTEFGNE
jgi:C1A family cysteine protease